jgi:hypothetical protein
MLRTARDRVRALVDEGKSREQVIEAKPTAELDATWVRGDDSREADFFVGLVYDGMVKGSRGG